ncbi:MAG: OmpA family protein [Ilumatobacteraceae bacterium]|jgi:outer membrane protein OmpA-like peptidoglycan-associated protein
MSDTDDTRDRIERLIAAADRVATRPVPSAPTPRRWLPVAATGVAVVAVLVGVNLASGGDRVVVVTQTSSLPTVAPGGQAASTPTSLPVVITISPTSSAAVPTSSAPVIVPSTTLATTGTTIAPTAEVVRWATYENGRFVLQGHVADQNTAIALLATFTAAAGTTNVRNEYVIRAGTARPDSEPLYAHDALQFPTGSASLQPAALAFLEVLGTFLLQNPGVTVDIDAFTDDTGPAEQNIALSQARADAVTDRLVALGVTRERMVATGHGPAQPVADNATEAGRAANRRVEFVLHDVLANG